MPDEADPPRKFYGFKPTNFHRANDLSASPPAEVPKPDPGIPTAHDEKIDVHELIRAGAGTGKQIGSNQLSHRENEVHQILRDNLASANRAGLNQVDLRKRRSRRTREYWITMGLVNAVLAACVCSMPLFACAGLVVFNLCYTWITWGVMDNY